MLEAPHVQDDAALLDLYRRTRSADAFTAIVQRHIGWVSALARRKVKDRHLAEDVTQAVFIILARKASAISRDTPLSAWLFRVARFAANDAVKQESRRRVRLNRAAAERAGVQPSRPSPELDLDEAIACLSDSDRQAIFLRFYEDKSMAEIGATLGINEVAAKKRVSRALRRLRELMARRGAPALSVAALALLLLRGTRAARAASIQTYHAVARAATSASEASGTSVRLADATHRRLAGAQSRLLAALAGAALVLLLSVSSIAPVMGQVVDPIVRAVRSIFAPSDMSNATAPAQPAPVPDPPPITRAWAGRTGTPIVPIYPSRSDGPIHITSPVGIDLPVVVVQDRGGRIWYRHVDADALPSLVGSPAAREDYQDLNPYASAVAERVLGEMINQNGMQFRASDSGGSWHSIDGIGDDGSIALPDLQMNQEYLVNDFSGISEVVEVPEPAFLSVGTLLAGAMLLRRRRNSSIAHRSR
jgi:RNA polymerase sigma factor (sigma-70 family)